MLEGQLNWNLPNGVKSAPLDAAESEGWDLFPNTFHIAQSVLCQCPGGDWEIFQRVRSCISPPFCVDMWTDWQEWWQCVHHKVVLHDQGHIKWGYRRQLHLPLPVSHRMSSFAVKFTGSLQSRQLWPGYPTTAVSCSWNIACGGLQACMNFGFLFLPTN